MKRAAHTLLIGLLIATACAYPRSAQAKGCTSFAVLILANAAGVQTLLDLPTPQANGLYAFGTIRLLPGDQLLFRVKYNGEYYDCTSQVSRDGTGLAGPGMFDPGFTYNVSAPGNYTTYNTTNHSNPDGTYGQLCSFTVAGVVNASEPIDLMMRVGRYLEGARANSGSGMRTDLALLGHIPCSEPYSAVGYPTSAAGVEHVDACTDLFIQKEIVDWVHVELRDPASPNTVVASANGLLSRTGIVFSTDGISSLRMTAPPGDYRLLIAHRNHLGILTNQAIPFRGQAPVIMTYASGGIVLYYMIGLVLPPSPTCAGEPCTMRLGNTNPTGTTQSVSYVGANNDRDPILARVGGSVPTNSVSGYYLEDVNMDGVVRYVGANNDRDPILQMIGGSTPTNVVLGQVP